MDGWVNSFAQVGDVMVVGGNFTTVTTVAAPNTNVARSYLFAFNISTGIAHLVGSGAQRRGHRRRVDR